MSQKMTSQIQDAETDEEMLDACKQFESYLVQQMFKSMEESAKVFSDDDEDKDSSLSTLTDFHMDSTIELVADEIVDQVGENYTQQLYEQMKRNYGIE